MTATAHTNTLPQHQHQHFSHFKTAFMGVELHAVCLILVRLTEHLKNKENEEQNYFSWYCDCMEDFLQLVCNGRFKISCKINVFQLQEGQFLHLLWPAHSRFSPYLNKLNLKLNVWCRCFARRKKPNGVLQLVLEEMNIWFSFLT